MGAGTRRVTHGLPVTGPSYKESKITGWGKKLLEEICTFLRLYTSDKSDVKGQWTKAAEQAALVHGKPTEHASRQIRRNAKEFVATQKPPENPYGTWARSKIEEDEELQQEINLHLQSKGKYVKAEDIVTYLKDPDVQAKWGFKKTIHLATAKRWMKKLGYRWVQKHRGLYADGHERPDVVEDRKKFLATWYELLPRMRTWTGDNLDVLEPSDQPPGTKGCPEI